MITRTCDGCNISMTEKDYEKKNAQIDGKTYCNKCAPKVNQIVGTLMIEKNSRLAAVETWYQAEKASQISAMPKNGIAILVEEEPTKIDEMKEGDDGGYTDE